MFIAPDPQPWDAKANTGVWAIRNTVGGRQIITEWLSNFPADKWTKDISGNWHSTGQWANATYEQGNFIETILNKYHNNIDIISQNTIQANSLNPGAFIAHMAGHKKSDLGKLLNATT